MKVSYKWLQEYFDEKLSSPNELEELFMMHAFEVDGLEELENGDTVIDLDILPNRAHDALGHRGVAKELSVLLDIPMKKDELSSPATKLLSPSSTKLEVEVQDTEWCPRYTGAYITGVKVEESPAWLKEKLEALGQKSINNVVDITNYVMFGLGQPTHIFDADKLTAQDSKVKIGVRKAKEGEKTTILGGDEYELDESIAVITDANTDKAIAIAGVKGGAPAEVDADTVNIVVESAKFHPIKTRRASAKLKIRTDAVQRFENEVAIQQPILGTLEVAKLIAELAGGTVEGCVDTNPGPFESHSVEIELADMNAFLGSKITIEETESILKRFGWDQSIDGERIVTVPPFERLDIRIKEDLYEEIGRVYGFGNITGGPLPEPAPTKFINKPYCYSEVLRGVLGEQGFTELSTYTLVDSGDIKLASILAADKDHVRVSLTGELTKALNLAVKNAPLFGEYEMVKVFEIGKVFTKKREYLSCAVAVQALIGKESKREARQKEELEKIQKYLEEALGAELKDPIIKSQLGNDDKILEFNLTDTIENLEVPTKYPTLPIVGKDVTYAPASNYPFVLRDIALWVPQSTEPVEVLGLIKEHASELLVRADLFDEFTKDDRTSYAFHLVFQSHDKTLTDEEVNAVMQKIEGKMQAKSWEVR